MCKISGFVWEIISAKYMYHSRNYCTTLRKIYPIFVVIHRSSPESDLMTFWCLVSNIKCLSRGDWKRLEIRLKIFRVAYMNSKQTWSLAGDCCQFEAKLRTLKSRRHFPPWIHFVAKIQWKSVLCSNEMSLNRPQTFDRICARTFDERSLEQRNSPNSVCITFAQYCICFQCFC